MQWTFLATLTYPYLVQDEIMIHTSLQNRHYAAEGDGEGVVKFQMSYRKMG